MPTRLEDWIKANPGKRLNDFYKENAHSSVQTYGESKYSVENKPNTGGTSRMIRFVLVALVLGIMILTNPKAEEHERVAQREFNNAIKNEVGDWGALNFLRNSGSSWLTRKLLDTGDRMNILIFSVHRIYFDGQHLGNTVGVLGVVFFVSK
jgi:hypothetical protein